MADDQWFAQFYRDSYSRLVMIMLAVTRDLADAEEVVQEAFLRAYSRRSRVQQVHNPEAWVCTVAMNIARRRARRRSMGFRLLARHEGGPADTPDPADALGDRSALMAAIRALPPDQRATVVLHHLADLPVAEVAVRTGVPVGTVKSRLSRARASLQDGLRGVADDDLLREADGNG